MSPLRFAIPLLAATAAAAQAELCIDRPAGERTPNATICASSVLSPQGGNRYGPENLDGDRDQAWCEGAEGDGRGEYLRIAYASPVRFRSIAIGNGYAKSPQIWRNNGRVRRLRIETGDGINIVADLPDRESHDIPLPRVAVTARVRITILAVYPGARHQDMCLHRFAPNVEAMDRET